MMFDQADRRRRFFIKKEFQAKFVLFYGLALALVAASAASVLYVTLRQSIETYLYASPPDIERSGDLLFDILIRINVAVSGAVVLLVVLVSVVVFRRLNLHFSRMELRLRAMAVGDFDFRRQAGSRFNEVSHLIGLVDESRRVYGKSLAELREAVDLLEQGSRGEDSRLIEAGKGKLDRLLRGVQIPRAEDQK